ncbi:MAG: hypothetical protein HQK60_01420 [Deltaproteobacteria bacterium]|nr:hypothetical protein [Deltaproteobacteria bacterium]
MKAMKLFVEDELEAVMANPHVSALSRRQQTGIDNETDDEEYLQRAIANKDILLPRILEAIDDLEKPGLL